MLRLSRYPPPWRIYVRLLTDRPSRLYKMFPTQGGVRVPFIVHYPPLHKSQRKLAPNSTNDTFTTVMDLMPTILDLAGIVHPTDAGQLHRGRAVEAMRGKSWKRWIEGAADEVHAEGVPHGWELHGRAGLRIGDWKMIWMRTCLLSSCPLIEFAF